MTARQARELATSMARIHAQTHVSKMIQEIVKESSSDKCKFFSNFDIEVTGPVVKEIEECLTYMGYRIKYTEYPEGYTDIIVCW